jgi:hypothetical protein
VAEFAESRPADVDRAQGERGAMSAEGWAARAEVLRPVSEWVTAELAIALNLTRSGAEGLLAELLTLVHRLPKQSCSGSPTGLWTGARTIAVTDGCGRARSRCATAASS